MVESQKTKKNDFIELKFTGYANGEAFDSNIEEDLKKLNSKAKPEKMIVIIGQGMVVLGLDKALEDKEFNKEYEISFSCKEGFGDRNRNLIRTIPLKAFTEQKIYPQAGMMLTLDNNLVKIIAVSGARVTADFNNPMASKDLKYKFIITKKVEDENEKIETVFNLLLRFKPKFEIKDNQVIVKGPKNFELFLNAFKDKFKELASKDLVFQEMTKEELDAEIKKHNEEHKHDHSHEGHEHTHEHGEHDHHHE
jgi:FKBP-type peptidyl-prolyl cis-trans isomerase SlyD